MIALRSNPRTKYTVILLAFLIIIANNPPVFSQVHIKEAAVTFIFGDVLILRKGAVQWQGARAGDILLEGDTIKTLTDAKAKLQFRSGYCIILKEETTLRIDKIGAESFKAEGKIEAFVPRGKIKAIIQELGEGSTFEVRTPTAVAGVAGTVFYLNVVESSGELTANLTIKPSIVRLLLDKILGGAKCYAAEGEGVITEIFVEEGTVNFTNLISQLSYTVGEDNSSYADEEGNITEPEYVPPEKQEEWKEGFEVGEEAEEEEEEEAETKKKEKSVVEEETPEEEEPEPEPEPEIVPPDPEIPPFDPPPAEEPPPSPDTTPPDTDTPVTIIPEPQPPDTKVDIGIDIEDENKQLAQELVDIHNDIVEITDRIILAQLDAKLTEIEDNQDGKVTKDMHGNRVRCDNYVLRPTDQKVAIVFLSHRREGVSSLSFEVAFNSSLDGINLKKLPWSDYMGSDDAICYASEPTSIPLPTEMTLKARNPQDDSVKMQETFASKALDNIVDTNWRQAKIGYNVEINGAEKILSADSTVFCNQQYTDGTYLTINGYLIKDYDPDIAGAPTATAFPLYSIRGIIRGGRTDNLELIFKSDKFKGESIDVIVAPEVMNPYYKKK